MYGYVYKTTNNINGKIYIGQHKSNKIDSNYKGSGTSIREAFNEFGKHNFDCSIIEWCDDADSLNKREAYWIDYYNSTNPDVGYNRAKYGTTCSEYQMKIASEYMRNRIVSDETRSKMSNSARNRVSNRITNNGKVWINNGQEEFLIDKSDYSNFGDEYYFGRIKNNYTTSGAKDKYSNGIYIHKGNQTKFIDKRLLESYINDGYEIGKGLNNYSKERNDKLKQSKSGTIAITDTYKTFYIKPELLNEFLKKGFVRGTYQSVKKLNDK